MEYAGVTRRFVALVIDGFVLLGISVVVGLVAGGAYSTSTANSYDAGIQVDTGPMLAALVLFFAYYVICEGLFGRTLGKRILSLRVVGEDGSPIYLGAAFLRNLLRLVDGLSRRGCLCLGVPDPAAARRPRSTHLRCAGQRLDLSPAGVRNDGVATAAGIRWERPDLQ
jgi:uncharacterized RDD family membrane protein YckC